MNIEMITKQDLTELKEEILTEISSMLEVKTEQNEWMKSADVRKMLKISAGTLQHLRVTRVLPYTKIGGSIFYSRADVLKVLNKNMRKAA